MQSSPLFDWNWNPEKYSDVDPTKKVICVNQGGTSSGKTYTLMQVLFKKAVHNRNWVITVVGQDMPNLKKGAIRDAATIVSNDEYLQSQIVKYNGSDKIYYFKSGSIIEFTSYDDEQDAKNGKRHVLFVNEANGIPYAIYNQLNMRTSQRTFIDYNPTSEFWAHEKVIGQPNVAFFISNYEHNPFLDPNIEQEILNLKNIDPQLWRVYGLGQTGKIEGLVFDFKTVNEMPEYLDKYGFGLDFGFSNDPTALVECGLSDGKLYGSEVFYQKGLTNSDINNLLKDAGITKGMPIFADAADPKSIEELRLYGWNIKAAPKGADSINYSISLLKQYGAINIERSSHNWIKEAKSYKWKEKNGITENKPVDAFNHAWDGCRYWAMGMLGGNNGKQTLAFSY